jgi:hypothetical protein
MGKFVRLRTIPRKEAGLIRSGLTCTSKSCIPTLGEGILIERPEPPLDEGKVPRLLEANNAERHKLFEGPHKPELTEAEKTLAKKRQELARVVERLRSPPLSHGIARELRKQQAILEREIAELEE